MALKDEGMATKMDPDAAALLVRYALGCADDLVKERKMDPQFAEGLKRKVFENRPATEGDAQKFAVAYLKCSSLARRMGKSSIDVETVRAYFFIPSEHNAFVDAVFKADTASGIKWGFEPSECKLQEGTVVRVGRGYAAVRALIDGKDTEKVCQNPLSHLKGGEVVVFHRGYVVEELSTELREFIDRLRNSAVEKTALLNGALIRGEKKVRIKS